MLLVILVGAYLDIYQCSSNTIQYMFFGSIRAGIFIDAVHGISVDLAIEPSWMASVADNSLDATLWAGLMVCPERND